MKNRCKLCGKDAGQYRICQSCYEANFRPCIDCGKPTPLMGKFGIPNKPTCVACTTRRNADSRKTGHRCKVCGEKSPDTHPDLLVCTKCAAETAKCPVCGNDMPKYIKRGKLRHFCSNECCRIVHPTTPEQIRKAVTTRWAGHIYRSTPNRLARNSNKFKEWRKTVFERDGFTCQLCGARNMPGNGATIVLHPHHLKPFATTPELRFDPDNGITLCETCHHKQHGHAFSGHHGRSRS